MTLKKVVVFEGPAGSGKSWLVDQTYANLGQFGLIPNMLPEIDRPRAYIGETGQWHAQLKDYRSALHMLMTPPPQVSLIDRWVVSQVVYDHIRRNQTKLNHDHLISALMVSMLNIWSTWNENRARTHTGKHNDPLTIHMLFVVIGSPATVTNSLRENNPSRSYPYAASDEADLYRQAAFAIQQWSHDPIEDDYINVRVGVETIYSSNLGHRVPQTLAAIKDMVDYVDSSAAPELPRFSPMSDGLPSQTATDRGLYDTGYPPVS